MQVAKEAALQFNPHANITAYHGNIKSHDFGVDFFRQFDLVMNALDNVGARRCDNRATDMAAVPTHLAIAGRCDMVTGM